MQGLKVSNYSQDFVIFSIKLETLEAVVFKQLRNKEASTEQLHTSKKIATEHLTPKQREIFVKI